MPVTLIKSSWSSGSLIFHEATSIAPSTTYNVFSLGTGAVKVGDTANDVDFQYYGTGSLSAIIDCGAATFTLVGIATATNGAVTITNATATSSTTTGALIVTGGIATAADITCGDDLFMSNGGVINFNAGNFTLTHSSGTLTANGVFATAIASASATPGTVRAIYGKYTTFTTMTSGNLVGVRGEITLGGSVSGGTAFLYGVQGKVITGTQTINNGSGMVYAVMGQLDCSGLTMTAGYTACIGADVYGVGSGTVNVDMFYGQHAGGGTIQSFLNVYGRATYAFIFNSNTGGTAISADGGTYSTADGYLLCYINGAAQRIPYFTAVDGG
uniref:Uncharacterized protein n=1 Tax=viral metagenome TaxID=1070528 RepID=A0A6M3KYD9_9ZZZZ